MTVATMDGGSERTTNGSGFADLSERGSEHVASERLRAVLLQQAALQDERQALLAQQQAAHHERQASKLDDVVTNITSAFAQQVHPPPTYTPSTAHPTPHSTPPRGARTPASLATLTPSSPLSPSRHIPPHANFPPPPRPSYYPLFPLRRSCNLATPRSNS